MLSALRIGALFVALPLLVPADDSTALKWHFTKGEVLRYRVLVEQGTEISTMPSAGVKLDMALVLDEAVRDVAADGSALLDMNYEALRMDSDSVTLQVHYDSTRTGAGAAEGAVDFAKIFDALLKAKVQMKMDPDGHVSDISGLQETIDKLAADMPKGQGFGGGDILKQMFGEAALRKMLEVNVFPGKALAVGDTWPRSLEIPNAMIGTMKYSMDSKFLGVEEHAGQSCAKIGVATKVSLGKGPGTEGGMKLDVSMDESDGKATQWFGLKTGHMLEITQTMGMTMKIGIPSRDEDPAHGMNLESTTDTTMHMLLLGKDEPAFEVEKKKETPKR